MNSSVRGQYVYFIQADDTGPIKIGFTTDEPTRRLAQLQTGNASPLKLLGAVKGDISFERKLHAALAEWRLQGEWFEAHPTVLSAVKEALASDSVPPRCGNDCLHCSMCLRCQHDTDFLMAGAAGNICAECIDSALGLLTEFRAKVP